MRLLLPWLVAALAFAQTARVEGTVVDSAGVAVPRAQVQLFASAAANYTAVSDESGKFAFENIEPGRTYQLGAQRLGFLFSRSGVLTLEAGQVLTGITIAMTPQGAINGRVLDAAGDPAQRAGVTLARRGYQRGAPQWVQAATARTDDRGEFRAANLPPGRYYVMATPSSSSGGLATTYYPSGTSLRNAAPIALAAGQDLRGIEIRLERARQFSIRGNVVQPDGAPAPGGMVLVLPLSAQSSSSLGITGGKLAPVRAGGAFEASGLVPGEYAVEARIGPDGPVRNAGRSEVRVTDSNVAGVVVTVNAPAMVRGSIRLEEGDVRRFLEAGQTQSAAAAIANTALGYDAAGMRMAIALTSSLPPVIGAMWPASVQEDGSFQIETPGRGNYSISFGAIPEGLYVKSARFNDVDVTHAEIDMTGGSGGTLEIVLSSKAANVTGSVRTGGRGQRVTLWTADPEPGAANNGIQSVSTDQDGVFAFKNLAPGVYYAAAWEEIDSGLATVRDFLNLMTTEATQLEVAEGGNVTAEVKVVPAAKIKAAEEKLP